MSVINVGVSESISVLISAYFSFLIWNWSEWKEKNQEMNDTLKVCANLSFFFSVSSRRRRKNFIIINGYVFFFALEGNIFSNQKVDNSFWKNKNKLTLISLVGSLCTSFRCTKKFSSQFEFTFDENQQEKKFFSLNHHTS